MKTALSENKARQPIQVYVASTPDEMLALERFRYDIYINELMDPLPWADHHSKRLIDPLDAGSVHLYTVGQDGGISGCGRLHFNRSLPGDLAEKLQLGHFLKQYHRPVAYMSRLMTAAAKRNTALAARLMCAMYEYIRERGCALGICHCNPRLSPLYLKAGLHKLDQKYIDPYVGEHDALVLLIEDEDHFRNLGSIFLPHALKYVNRKDRVETLYRALGLRRYSPAGSVRRYRDILSPRVAA
jgi:predicted GNAT family N-acyltransferase